MQTSRVAVVLGVFLLGWVSPGLVWAVPVKTIQIRDDLRITRSVKFRPGKYVVPDANSDGVIQILADDITVDMTGVELWGGPSDRAEGFTGTGILLNGRKGVRIIGGKIHGYRTNVRILNSSDVSLTGIDVSYPRGPIISTDGEKKQIWLGLRNLKAWRDYGAGIWLENCTGVLVENCQGHHAANGLLTVNTKNSRFHGNDFSFNSGWGIGLWQSSGNEVFWNRLDFVGRPWDGSVGADAASLVLVNGCHRNWIIGNSMTHSGDGFFLTMLGTNLEGEFPGTCDDNVVALNDGSYSPHNAFESTFSFRNLFVRNLANHSDYGFWLGYSRENLLLENQINWNNKGIAIEHGRDSSLVGNGLVGNRRAAIDIWARYLQGQMPSRNYLIAENRIRKSPVSLRLRKSQQITVRDNAVSQAPPVEAGHRQPSSLSFSAEAFWRGETGQRILALERELPRRITFYSQDADMPQGLWWYRYDRWAPRDFRKDPCAIAVDPDGVHHVWILRSELSPAQSQKGFRLEPTDSTRHWIVRTLDSGTEVGGRSDFELALDSESGDVVRVPFRVTNLEWRVRYFRQGFSVDAPMAKWLDLFAGDPITTLKQTRLDDRWKNDRRDGQRWSFVATTTYRFQPGTYEFITLSDDGVRVAIDGKPVIENWTHHGAKTDTATIELDGKRTITVWYCQNGGGSAFSIDWDRIDD